MGSRYDATSEDDMARLAMNLATTPSDDYWRVMGHVYDLSLMRFRGPMALALRLARLKGKTGVFQFFKILQDRFPATMMNCMLSTIDHVVTGTDREDQRSFGGWSQREVDLFFSRVSFSADTVAK